MTTEKHRKINYPGGYSAVFFGVFPWQVFFRKRHSRPPPIKQAQAGL
jgi:hypothetical protein